MKTVAAAEATENSPLDYSELPDLTEPGPYDVVRYRLDLEDESRNRQFYVDFYRPRTLPSGDIPVIVYSHGLGDDPTSFAAQAEHLGCLWFLW